MLDSQTIGTSEADLWASVLLNAIADGFYGCAVSPTAYENQSAISFLVAPSGEWAASRKAILGALGINEQAFVAMCKAVFEGAEPPLLASERGNLDMQRERYRKMQKGGEQPAPVKPKAHVLPGAIPGRPQPIVIDDETRFLYWAISAPDKGDFGIMTLPRPESRAYKVMRVLTRKGGGNPRGLIVAAQVHWAEMIEHICRRYEVEAVYLNEDGLDVGAQGDWAKVFLRLPL